MRLPLPRITRPYIGHIYWREAGPQLVPYISCINVSYANVFYINTFTTA
jgi:hypothetical protein